MHFFESKETLTDLEWILRAVVSFIFLLASAKLMGQRSISQLRFLDFIIALTLGNIIAHPLSDEKLGLRGSMITTIALIVLYLALTWLGLKWTPLKRFLDPTPITLVKSGIVQFHNLTKAKISVEYLFSELRKEKASDISKVSLAVWEPGGTVSVFLDTPYQPVTPSDLQLATKPFSATRPVIVDGVVDMTLLQAAGKDLEWLSRQIAPSKLNIGDIMLATLADDESVKVYTELKNEFFSSNTDQ